MAWKKYSELSKEEKMKRAKKHSVTNSITSPKTKALMRSQSKKKTISTDWS